MKKSLFVLLVLGLFSTSYALVYTFDTDVEGFQNVAWQASGNVKQTHTAGGWQMLLTKEFSWTPGGGEPVQQLAMQALANDPDARISFDLWLDGNSFPAGVATWYQFNLVGNSDGTAGWTQLDKVAEGYHSEDDQTVLTWHIDLPFSALGWQPGDGWFQLWTGANSEDSVPVNFYIDNVRLVPEPATLSLLGLGAAALLRKKK